MHGFCSICLAKLQRDVILGPIIDTTGGGIVVGSLLNEERRKYEKERKHLFKELDEKGENIKQQSQYLEELKKQIVNLVASTSKNFEVLQQKMGIVTRVNESSKEIKDVLQMFEELAVNFDEKSPEMETSTQGLESLIEEPTQKQSFYNISVEHNKEQTDSSKNQHPITGMLTNLLQGVSEIGAAIGLESDVKILSDNVDELKGAGRYVSKVKSEVQGLVQRCKNLEASQRNNNIKVRKYEEECTEQRLLISQHEVNIRNLEKSARKAEIEKQLLEETIYRLKKECAEMAKQRNACQEQGVSPGKELSEEPYLIHDILRSTTQQAESASEVTTETDYDVCSACRPLNENEKATVVRSYLRLPPVILNGANSPLNGPNHQNRELN